MIRKTAWTRAHRVASRRSSRRAGRSPVETLESRRLLSTTIAIGLQGINGIENQAFANNTVGTFSANTSSGPVTSAAGYRATIDWGDGSQSDAMIGAPTENRFPIEGSHTYVEGGNYPITVLVTAADGTTATSSGALAYVADAALSLTPLSVSEAGGEGFTARLAQLTDADAAAPVSDYTATINWGDGSTTDVGQFVSTGGGQVQVVGSHTYPAATSARTYSVFVAVRDVDGYSVNTTSTVQVGPLSPLRPPQGGTAELPPNGAPATLATFDDPNGPGGLTASIDWGDGTTTPGSIVLQGGTTYDVDGGHAYTQPPPPTINVTVTGGGGNPQTLTVPVAVQPTPGAGDVVPVSGVWNRLLGGMDLTYRVTGKTTSGQVQNRL